MNQAFGPDKEEVIDIDKPQFSRSNKILPLPEGCKLVTLSFSEPSLLTNLDAQNNNEKMRLKSAPAKHFLLKNKSVIREEEHFRVQSAPASVHHRRSENQEKEFESIQRVEGLDKTKGHKDLVGGYFDRCTTSVDIFKDFSDSNIFENTKTTKEEEEIDESFDNTKNDPLLLLNELKSETSNQECKTVSPDFGNDFTKSPHITKNDIKMKSPNFGDDFTKSPQIVRKEIETKSNNLYKELENIQVISTEGKISDSKLELNTNNESNSEILDIVEPLHQEIINQDVKSITVEDQNKTEMKDDTDKDVEAHANQADLPGATLPNKNLSEKHESTVTIVDADDEVKMKKNTFFCCWSRIL